MNILTLVHGMILSGAQISTLEQLELLKKNEEVYIKVVICHDANKELIHRLSLETHIHEVPCAKDMGYPMMNIKKMYKHVEWADTIWITDVEYLVAPWIKRIKNIPIVAHLHSYALVCPWWGALYGFKEPCLERCSVWRITRCKQGVNLELAKMDLLGGARARLYWLLDFVKGPLDFFRWSRVMNNVAESIDGFIAVSKALWDIHVHHLLSLSNKPFSIVYNPVTEPLKHVKPEPHEPYGDYVLYASGSNTVKGPHLLLEAWQEVSKEFRDLKLYMVGCKNTWVERKAHQMALRNIVFMERLPPDRRYYYLMYKAKAVVMPSLVPEAFGRIPVEANRLGVPAVVTNRGALPEIVKDGTTGIITEADSDSLANAIARAISREWDRNTIMRRSFELINPTSIIDELIKFFERILG